MQVKQQTDLNKCKYKNNDAKKIGTEVFGEHWNVVLEENGEDQMVRESN